MHIISRRVFASFALLFGAVAAGLTAGLPTAVHAQTTVTVAANDNIFGAGHSAAPGGGLLPPSISLSTGVYAVTFPSVSGSISLNNGANYNNPDGVGAQVGQSTTTATEGISGLTAPDAGYLVGVFLSNVEPADPAPASLDFTQIGTNFATLSPALDQTFFIGDGLTGNGTGSLQQFVVPAGATRLFLGIADESGGSYNGPPGSYGDNLGSFSATVTSVVPEPSTWAGVLGGGSLLVGVLRWRTRVRG